MATRASDGWFLSGHSPWVTGWGLIDLIHVAARAEDGSVIWGLIDAVESATLKATRLRLSAVNASATVTLAFQQHPLTDDRVTFRMPYEHWQEIDATNLRTNGSLALGLVGRCARLADSPAMQSQLEVLRSELDAASPDEMPALRARASELSLRAAATVLVARGSQELLTHRHGPRLLREAGFLLVFGSRPRIKQGLISELGG
jgi:alkylation response protein AidB-like acyl-CoA dehydrogenase